MMDRGYRICMADIQNKIYEAGLFRPGEKVVLTTKSSVLLEYFTGKAYSYRMVDLHTLRARHLFSRAAPLTETGYRRAMERMLAQAPGDGSSETGGSPARAEEFLVHIFCDILPGHGFTLREEQVSLSLAMLEAMEKTKTALCEAEVGTGKTHAYLLAAVVYRLFHEGRQPAVISTSTIALQKALTEEYIPQLSRILLEHRVIDSPLTFAVRKGRSHYACDSRVKTYLSSVRHNDREEERELAGILTALFTGACSIDLDTLPLTDYVKDRICVERCRSACEFASVCRYHTFLRRSGQTGIDFQIVNHNIVLADVLSRKGGRGRLLPEHRLLILDEAHRLPDTAGEMYGSSFEDMELVRLAEGIRRAAGGHPDKKKVILLCDEMVRQNTALFKAAKSSAGICRHPGRDHAGLWQGRTDISRREYAQDTWDDDNAAGILLSSDCLPVIRSLAAILRDLSVLFHTEDRRDIVYKKISGRIAEEQDRLAALQDCSGSVHWLEMTGTAACRICTLPKQPDRLLHEDMWSRGKPYLLTSATLSVGGDFSRFMHRTGIDLLERRRILTVSKASPFDYRDHALLYLPEDMPYPDMKSRIYMDAVLCRLEGLIRQTHGHTLILFTSYRMMERICRGLSERITDYPLFSMGRGRLEAIRAFRKSGNGVLLASDSAGEGIDLAGDILSSLVVVRLPFPAPGPASDYERSLYDDFHSYLSEVIVPDMLTKLRQWIGRGIRRETDTCVFSILDSRAGGRYRKEILSALPDMPVTEHIGDVGRFIRKNKAADYFMNEKEKRIRQE